MRIGVLFLPWPRVLVYPISEYHWLCTGRVELVFGEPAFAEMVAQIRFPPRVDPC